MGIFQRTAEHKHATPHTKGFEHLEPAEIRPYPQYFFLFKP
jgi:hypothetical protein